MHQYSNPWDVKSNDNSYMQNVNCGPILICK